MFSKRRIEIMLIKFFISEEFLLMQVLGMEMLH